MAKTSKPGCLGILTMLLALIINTAGATRSVVKTIQISNGDIIDCFGIYKQPAFDHPLLKNHTIEVFPSFFQDFEPRIFVSWKVREGNRSTGCINLACPGFVQTSHSIVLGGQLPVSTSNGSLSIIKFEIKKNRGVWSVLFNDEYIGYWSYATLNDFTKARVLRWAGRVKNQGSGPEARTQMGNGHFATDGFGNAAHFGSMKYKHKSGHSYVAAKNIQIFATLPQCYNIIKHPETPLSVGPMIVYGGPGGPSCY